MEILDESIDDEFLKETEEKYRENLENGIKNDSEKFDYACSLLRTRHRGDIIRGILILEDLIKTTNDENILLHCLFYLALSFNKLGEYAKAKEIINRAKRMRPKSRQFIAIDKIITRNYNNGKVKDVAKMSIGTFSVILMWLLFKKLKF